MLFQKIKSTTDTTQHAKRQHINLQNTQRIQIILVPFHNGSLIHCSILNRYNIFQYTPCDDKASNMLGQMAGKADQLTCKRQGHRDKTVIRIKSGFPYTLRRHTRRRPAPGHFRHGAHHIFRQSQRLSHFANGTAGTVCDNGRREPCPIPTIFAVNILNDLLTPLMLKINVNVRRFVPLGRNKPLKQKIDFRRINSCNTQTITNSGIGG